MTPHRIGGNSGYYMIADGSLYGEPGSIDSGLNAWVRLGSANDRANPIDTSVGGGLVYAGPFGRKSDFAGLSVGYVHFDRHARRADASAGDPIGRAEAAIEATYAIAVRQMLTVQPDIQYVISPGADPALDNALIVGTRIVIAW